MKRLQALFLVALSSSLLLSACGKEKEETIQPVVEPIVEAQPEIKEEDVEEADEGETENPDMPPAEGMVRSRITNEWVDEEVDKTRPIAVMIPNTKTASHYGLS